MIVIADASPLNYLVLIEQIHLLSVLYGKVLVPAPVRRELLWVGAPPAVKKWIASLPPWVEICTIGGTPDERLMALDPGERAAIMLALERQADLILIDDMEGRREAQRRDIRVAGTLAVLDQAAREGLINFAVVLQSLRETNFRLTDELASQLLRRHPSD